MAFFDFLKRPREDVRIELPGIDIAFNHRLKVAFLYTTDSDTKDDAFADLEKHLKKRGYTLTIIIAPIGMRYPATARFPVEEETA